MKALGVGMALVPGACGDTTIASPPDAQPAYTCGLQTVAPKFEFVGWSERERAELSERIRRFLPILDEIAGPPHQDRIVQVIRDPKVSGGTTIFPAAEILLGDVRGPLAHELVHVLYNAELYPDQGVATDFQVFAEGIAQFIILEADIRLTTQDHPAVNRAYGTGNADGRYYDLWFQPDLAGVSWVPPRPRSNPLPQFYKNLGRLFAYRLAPHMFAKLYTWRPDFLSFIHTELCGEFERLTEDPEARLHQAGILLERIGNQIEGQAPIDWLYGNPLLNPQPESGFKIYTDFYPSGFSEVVIRNIYAWQDDEKISPYSGSVHLTFYSYDNQPLLERTIGITEGQTETFYRFDLAGTTVGPERLRLEVRIGEETRSYFFPFQVQRGTQSEFGGAVVGIDAGTALLEIQGQRVGSAPISKGAFVFSREFDPVELRPELRYTVGDSNLERGETFVRQAHLPSYHPVLVMR